MVGNAPAARSAVQANNSRFVPLALCVQQRAWDMETMAKKTTMIPLTIKKNWLMTVVVASDYPLEIVVLSPSVPAWLILGSSKPTK